MHVAPHFLGVARAWATCAHEAVRRGKRLGLWCSEQCLVHHRVMATAPKGYLVEVNSKTNVVYLKVWGQWEEADGRAYVEFFRGKVAHLLGKKWYVVADISEFPPQNDAVNAQIAKTMEHATKGGMVKA